MADKTKAICPFDKNHVIVPADKLKSHIQKCKSPNKYNFQQCQYNPDHWINFSQLKQHQQKCYEQKRNSQNIVSMSQDSVLKYLCEELDNTKKFGIQSEIQMLVKKQQEQKNQLMKKKKKKNRKYQQEPTIQRWDQPNFKDWVIKSYGRKENIEMHNRPNRFQFSDQLDKSFNQNNMSF